MRIIAKKFLEKAQKTHPKARASVSHWLDIAAAAHWNSLADTRLVFPHADQVAVKSKKTVTVFNITNDFRLITAIHYNTGIVYTLRFLTHAEYSKNNWKNTL